MDARGFVLGHVDMLSCRTYLSKIKVGGSKSVKALKKTTSLNI